MKNSKVIPAAIIALIVTFMVLDLFFYSLSSYTFTGLYAEIIKKPKIGLNIDKPQIIKNLKIDIKFNQDYNMITVKLTDDQGKEVTGADVKAKIMRTVTTSEDQVIVLNEIKPGLYLGKCPQLNSGKWNIRVKAQFDDLYLVGNKSIIIN